MSKSHWAIIFAIIFILSQDYLLIIEWPEKLLGGLPIWIFYFIAVHAIFIYAIYRLAVTRNSEQ